MPRRPFLSRLRRPSDAPQTAAAAPPRAVRRPLPPPSRLRRERRALLRAREDRIRDLGGLVLEMYRRDGFREDLLSEQCAELVGLEERLHELDALLAAASTVRRTAPGARCACGAPILWGSHFCANCGRPAEVVPPRGELAPPPAAGELAPAPEQPSPEQ